MKNISNIFERNATSRDNTISEAIAHYLYKNVCNKLSFSSIFKIFLGHFFNHF